MSHLLIFFCPKLVSRSQHRVALPKEVDRRRDITCGHFCNLLLIVMEIYKKLSYSCPWRTSSWESSDTSFQKNNFQCNEIHTRELQLITLSIWTSQAISLSNEKSNPHSSLPHTDVVRSDVKPLRNKCALSVSFSDICIVLTKFKVSSNVDILNQHQVMQICFQTLPFNKTLQNAD